MFNVLCSLLSPYYIPFTFCLRVLLVSYSPRTHTHPDSFLWHTYIHSLFFAAPVRTRYGDAWCDGVGEVSKPWTWMLCNFSCTLGFSTKSGYGFLALMRAHTALSGPWGFTICNRARLPNSGNPRGEPLTRKDSFATRAEHFSREESQHFPDRIGSRRGREPLPHGPRASGFHLQIFHCRRHERQTTNETDTPRMKKSQCRLRHVHNDRNKNYEFAARN